MVSRGNIDMISALNENRNLEDSFQSELEFLLQEQRNQSIIERERELNIYRSGSAPPTVEGSLSAVDSLFRHSDYRESNIRSINNNNGVLSEDEIRSHPAYLTYYYSHDNVNPRLPPPLLSKEDWRVALRFQESGSSFRQVEDWRRKLDDGGSSSSLFSMQPGISMHHREKDLEELRNSGGRNLSRQASSEWHDRPADGLIGLSSNGLGTRRKSFADILQEGLDRPNSLSGQISRPTSHNAFGDTIDETTITDPRLPGIYNGVGSIKALRNRVASAGPVGGQSLGNTIPHSFSSAVGSSLSRSTTPEPQLVGRSPSPGVPPVGSRVSAGSKVPDGHSSGVAELNDIANNLSSLNLSNIRHGGEDTHIQSQLHQHLDKQPGFLFNMPYDHSTALQHQVTDYPINENLLVPYNYVDISTKNGIVNVSKMTSMDQVNFSKRTDNNLYSKASSSGFGSVERSSTEFADHMPGHFAIDEKLNSTVNNHLNAGYGGIQSSSGARGHVPSDLYSPELNFTPGTSDYAAHARSNNLDPSQLRNYSGVTRNLEGLQTAYVEELLSQQKRQYELSFLGKSGGYTQRYYGSPSYGHGIPYLGNPMSGSGLSSVASGYQMLQNERVSCFNSMMRSSMGGYIGSWHTDLGSSIEGRPSSSLLDEFKSNKSKSFELSDITNHVVEFSTDQYGSRFIQQKLETTTVEEKSQIFPEIIPHARTLMTDVFGNYVIQKFFEYGTKGQREELASQLTGHVLPLSLQMYGCRVIQKALEVVDVDRQTQMVAELDGSVMKCVRDQNGNHVIQKCIECVPQDRIQFIISAFYGQVIALSTHPYGCRVIQRVLEHCDDLSTQQTIMEEIMRSVCPLSQDQYGNYVIQHVLEQGKPHERSAIISKLAGQIVQMSQQKYASNVVEKCLTFGGPDERQLLVNEMLGSTDENEPLQAMMKDPFGNYVVQKILETCDDRSLELLLSRIRVHLNSLKKYTYGKHIVSRVEKLIMTGETRIGLSSKGIVPN